LDIETNPSDAINLVDKALGYISEQRANLGAIANRLASTIVVNESISLLASNSRSRIMDADFATETSQLSKQQILQQSSSAMIFQANSSISNILSLLS